MDITCLGELLVDMFPAEVGRRLVDVTAFHPKPGGAPANVAVAAARLGLESAFIGKVGDDAFGHHLAATLGEEGVNVDGILFDTDARTSMAFIALLDENTAEFVFYRNPGADMLLRAEELNQDLLMTSRAFHFGSISLIQEPSRSATIHAINVATQAKAIVTFDVNYRPSLWRDPMDARLQIMSMLPFTNLVKVNDTELALLADTDDLQSGCFSLLGAGPELCVVTLGNRGSYFQFAGGGQFVPPFNVPTVDATGCGDAFMAGLLSKLVSTEDWRENFSIPKLFDTLRFANAVGALTATKLGVIPALPSLPQVEAFLEEHDQ